VALAGRLPLVYEVARPRRGTLADKIDNPLVRSSVLSASISRYPRATVNTLSEPSVTIPNQMCGRSRNTQRARGWASCRFTCNTAAVTTTINDGVRAFRQSLLEYSAATVSSLHVPSTRRIPRKEPAGHDASTQLLVVVWRMDCTPPPVRPAGAGYCSAIIQANSTAWSST
jgi:hypothetical protein